MELLDRYLQAIEFWLPKRQRQDIIAELSEDLRSQIDERETELGRKLGDGEVEAILKRCGPPLTVALRYRPQQYLIGPTLFPIYQFVLAVLVAGCIIPRFLIWLGFLIVDPAHRGYLHMENLWATLLYFVFFTTLAFVIIERSGVKLDCLHTWNPRKLPPRRDPNRIARGNSLFEIAVLAAFNVWFAGMFWPRPVIDLYGAQITPAPAWKFIFWSDLILSTCNLAISAVNLFYPYWTRLRASLRLMTTALGYGVFCWLCRAQVVAAVAPADAAKLARLVNAAMPSLFWFAIAVGLVTLAFDLRRIIRVKAASSAAVNRLAHA
jgi:hypothetical protein